MKKRKLDVANYVNTGGFNRLAGRPAAPGSWQPERSSRNWRMVLTAAGAVFLLIGMFFVIF